MILVVGTVISGEGIFNQLPLLVSAPVVSRSQGKTVLVQGTGNLGPPPILAGQALREHLLPLVRTAVLDGAPAAAMVEVADLSPGKAKFVTDHRHQGRDPEPTKRSRGRKRTR